METCENLLFYLDDNKLSSYAPNELYCLMLGEGLFLRESDPNAIEPRRVGVLLLFSNRLEKLLDERRLLLDVDCFRV